MAARTGDRPGLPVLALKHPRHEVDHVHFALHDDAVVVVAQESSKEFICYSLMKEFSQRYPEKWTVLLNDGCSDVCSHEVIKTLVELLPNKPIRYLCHKNKIQPSSLQNHVSGSNGQNTLVTTHEYLLHCFVNGYLKVNDISLLIANSCLPVNVALGKDCPYKEILDVLRQKVIRPRIIGLMCLDLANISNASELNMQFEYIETIYNLPIHLSRDLLAMNGYSEEIAVENFVYGSKPSNVAVLTVHNSLKDLHNFLTDINILESPNVFKKLEAVVAWSIEALTMFGLWGFYYYLESIQKAFHHLEAKVSNPWIVLTIQSCRSQYEVFRKWINSAFQNDNQDTHSELILQIFDVLSHYQVYCDVQLNNDKNSENVESATVGQKPCSYEKCLTQETRVGDCHSSAKTLLHVSETKQTLKMKPAKIKSTDQLRCIIVTKNSSSAKMVSTLINHLASTDERPQLFKTCCITESKKSNLGSDNQTESELHARVQQGEINIVVTTLKLFSELKISYCNIVMYFGMPENYKEYFSVKRTVRGLAPKLVLVLSEELQEECARNLQQLKNIEDEMEKRMSGYISLKKKATLLENLAKYPQHHYAPFGKDGPCVSMSSSIHIINSYCCKIARGDFSNFCAQFITQKKNVAENMVIVSSDLCLPLGSSCHEVIQGPSIYVRKDNDLEIEVGVLRSKMDASLACVKLLHKNGNLDDDLELVEERFVDSNDNEDEGKARAGTNKRRRGYKIKSPIFLKDNMPVANEQLFLYHIKLVNLKIYSHCKSDALEQRPDPEIELGILCGKPLPRIPKFVIYTPEREVAVSITATQSVPLYFDQNTLDRIRLFHRYVFQDFLQHDQKSILSEKDGYLVVPLVARLKTPTYGNELVHWSFLDEFERLLKDADTPLESESGKFSACQDYSIFKNKIVRRRNHSVDQLRNTKQFVVKICKDMSPNSPFPDPDIAATFSEYYRTRYDIEVNSEQPLLLVQYLPARANFLFPRYRQKDDEISEDLKEKVRTEIHLIPELCSILPLSVSAWGIIRYLPTIACRLSSFLLAYEFQHRVEKETGVGLCSWPNDIPLPELNCGDKVGEETLVFMASRKEVSSGMSAASDEYVIDDHHQAFGEPLTEWEGSSDGNEKVKVLFRDDKAVKTPSFSNEPSCCGSDKCSRLRNDEEKYDSGCYDKHINTVNTSAAHPPREAKLHSLPTPTTGPNIGPCVTLILRALTARCAGQPFHSERLEVLGDSFLKLEISAEVYLTATDKDEWGLSMLRCHFVSNNMLSTQGRRLGLPGYMITTLPDIPKNSLPPGFTIQEQRTNAAVPDGSDVSEVPLNAYCHQIIGDKLVANCVEALIGAYLVSSGRAIARLLLIWLGISTHSLEDIKGLFKSTMQSSVSKTSYSMSTLANQHLRDDQSSDVPFWCFPASCQLPDFSLIEEEIVYCFKNKYLLLQALTHSSYSRSLSSVSESYQKMEFLGDAVLDYLVTWYLFDRFPQLDHGDLTDFRSALVNNFTLAFLGVQNHLHRFMRCMSPSLVNVVRQFVEFLQEQEARQGASWKNSIDAFAVGNPAIDESSIEVPKVLGDIFEAVVCAVFLDSEMNLDVVWDVVYPMLEPFIDYYKDSIPRSPVRTLQETFPDQVTFSLSRVIRGQRYSCSVHVVGYGDFEATGRTPKIAKASVARNALDYIRKASSGL